jgi:hypothetical protein
LCSCVPVDPPSSAASRPSPIDSPGSKWSGTKGQIQCC